MDCSVPSALKKQRNWDRGFTVVNDQKTCRFVILLHITKKLIKLWNGTCLDQETVILLVRKFIKCYEIWKFVTEFRCSTNPLPFLVTESLSA
jgi:hypothetical protein